MKILQINAVYGNLSTGRTMQELSDFIIDNGHISYLAYKFANEDQNTFSFESNLEIKFHSLFSRITGLQAYFSRYSTNKLLEFIDLNKIDIIHLRNLHDNYINLNLLLSYCKIKNIPVVFTLHDSWFYNAKSSDFLDDIKEVDNNVYNYKTLNAMNNKSWFFDRSKKMIEDRKKITENMIYAAVGVSNWITDKAKNSYLGNASEIITISNWIDTTVFYPRKTYEPLKKKTQDKFIILGVASFWTENKGIDHFIQLSKNIKSDEIIVLVGSIDKSIELPSNIISITLTNESNILAEIYSTADVFLNLSPIETFGKVSAESMACGTPVITNKYSANPEIVSQDTGIILESITNAKIVDAISEVRSKGKLYYSQKCIDRVISNYNLETNCNQYLELYNRLNERRTTI